MPDSASSPPRARQWSWDGSPRAVVVVLATTPAAGLTCAEGTLLDRLADQLQTLPVLDLHVVARADDPLVLAPYGIAIDADPDHDTLTDLPVIGLRGSPRRASRGPAEDLRGVAAIARSSAGPVVVLPGDLIAHTEALALVLDHPTHGTSALIGGREAAGPLRAPVRVEHGRVASAGNVFHEVTSANATFASVLQVGEADLATLADVADELAHLGETGGLGPLTGVEAGDLLLTGLVRTGIPVRAALLGTLHARRVTSQYAADDAIARLAQVDEAAARLDAAVKNDDGLFTTYAVSSWSRHLVPLAARLALTPNAVTGISVGFAAIAATWFSAGDRTGLVLGAAAFYLSFVFDCVDGQLARFSRRFSPLGAWLDATFDRVKEYLVYAGLAAGYGGPGGVWGLAVAAMLLQALRHMIDFAYTGALADAAKVGVSWLRPTGSLSLPYDDRPTAPPGQPGQPGQGSPAGAQGGKGLVHWLKKTVILPIGERTALICVTAALFDARVTFLALLVWGGIAALYTLGGRVGRSLR